MEKKFIAEIEERYIRQSSALDHYAIVTIQIYTITTNEVIFENHCTPEQLPEKFVGFVEKSVFDYTAQLNITGILVCLTDAVCRQYDSSGMDFSMATLKALLKIFPQPNEI